MNPATLKHIIIIDLYRGRTREMTQSNRCIMISLVIMILNVYTLIYVYSLYRNIDEIRVFLHNNDIHIHIMALNETLLDDSISDNELYAFMIGTTMEAVYSYLYSKLNIL